MNTDYIFTLNILYRLFNYHILDDNLLLKVQTNLVNVSDNSDAKAVCGL